MEETKSNYKVHVFVCTNEKKSGEGCACKGALDIQSELKSWVKEHPDWKKRIRINKSGCLDRCSEAVAIAIYPHDEWFVNARKSNLDEIKAKITELMNESETKDSSKR
jgi:NADH:ubiquinone oxidoreductase subunit E